MLSPFLSYGIIFTVFAYVQFFLIPEPSPTSFSTWWFQEFFLFTCLYGCINYERCIKWRIYQSKMKLEKKEESKGCKIFPPKKYPHGKTWKETWPIFTFDACGFSRFAFLVLSFLILNDFFQNDSFNQYFTSSLDEMPDDIRYYF